MADASEYNRRYFARLADEMAKSKPRQKVAVERTMAWVETQGVVICEDASEKKRLAEFIAPIAAIFPDLMKTVCAVYVYRTGDQTGPDSGADGICWMNVTNYAGTLYAIGISTEALDRGPEYTALVFMHELAHAATGDSHSADFHNQLNYLLSVFNEATGANIVNDYFGLNLRYDSRPYTLPDSIPVRQSRKGSAFRTEAKR